MIEPQPSVPIDRDSFVPLYVQVKQHLQRQIEQGVWQPGEQMPSETELCNTYEISRTVIRRALLELQHEGLIYSRKGKGSFVAEPRVHEVLAQNLTGFYHDMKKQGRDVSSRVLRMESSAATDELAAILDVELDEPLVVCERLRLVDGKAINLSISHVPEKRCPDLMKVDLSNESLYATIERARGQRIVKGRRTIEATLPTEQIADLLGIDVSIPVFRINTICYLEDGTPIEYSLGYHRSDRTYFEVALLRETGNGIDDVSVALDRLPQSHTLAPRPPKPH